jgi:macrodomain Ter protein organizer (MatP/YcbG family)
MTDGYPDTEEESANQTKETVEISSQIWQRVCDESASKNMTNSELIEDILTQHLKTD